MLMTEFFMLNMLIITRFRIIFNCDQDDDDQDPELERAIRMSLECQDDFSDVNITQLNNIRRCFVLQKREFDRVYDKTNDQ